MRGVSMSVFTSLTCHDVLTKELSHKKYLQGGAHTTPVVLGGPLGSS